MNFSSRFAGRGLPCRRLPNGLVVNKPRLAIAAAVLAAFSGSALAASDVAISQVYGGGGNSGATLKNDFIELFNRSASAVSLSGWSVRYTSAAGTFSGGTALTNVTLQPGQYYLVQEAAGTGGSTNLPTADATGTLALSGTTGKVALVNNGGTLVDLVAYGPTAAPSEGNAPAPVLTSTTAAFRAANGCTDTDNNAADFSTGGPAPRNTASAFNACGGATGGTVTPPVALTIMQIQGNGATSAYAGVRVTTEGVVTLKTSNGFFFQNNSGDGNPATSDGIFVFGTAAVSVGDMLRLSATVTEFNAGDSARTVTELTGIGGLTVLSQGNVVTPTAIGLPLPNGVDFERYEGMLVRFTAPLSVDQNYFQGRYGQLTLSSGRLEKPTNRYPARSAQAIAAAALNAANVIILDDASSLQNPNPIPYIGVDNTTRAGDTVANLTGVIDFGLITSSNPGPTGYKLQPTVAPTFTRVNARSAAPFVAPGNIKVASFNVLNFFTTFSDGTTADGLSGQGCSQGATTTAANCRGADNGLEFVRQRDKIVSAMLAINADALGLMEIQNNGETAVNNLVASLNAQAGAGTYRVVPKPLAAAGTGSDAIRVAMIYKPANLGLVGPSLSDTDAINNRPPLAQTFITASGQRFSLIVNHLKSKSGCPPLPDPDADQGDGQGCFNATRKLQAQRLASVFIPTVQATAQADDVLIIGDLNAYGAEDPIAVLASYGLVNQIERLVRPATLPYSYVFDGEAGYIDHALTTASLSSQVVGVTEWHINADEPSVIDYNTEFKPQDLYSATPYRSSDHDPVVVSLNLSGALNVTNRVNLVSSGMVLNRTTQQYNTTLSITNTSNATIAGPLQLEISGLPAGVTVANASATRNGVPYLGIGIGALAPGQKTEVNISFSDPSKVAISYTAKVYSGTF